MKKWKKWLGLVVILLLALGVSGCSSKDAAESYADAQQLLAEGRYADSAAAFASLGSYEESSRLSMYAQAHAEAGKGNYSLAATSMAALGDFRDAELQAVYYRAQQLLKTGPVDTSCYGEAGELLAQLGVFRKSHQVNVQEVAYQDGLRLLNDESYDQAAGIFSYLRYYYYDYKDSRQLYFYTLARQNEALGELVHAVNGYADLNGFRDSDKRMKKCADAAYQELQSFVDAGDLKSARTQLNNMLRNSHFSGYEDLALLDTYLSARELEKSGGADIDSYTRAAALYAGLGDYRDSAKRAKSIPQSIYDNAMAALEQGDYKTATTLFGHQKDYRDSRTMIDYTEACRLQSVAVGKRDQLKNAVERNKATWSDLNGLWDAVKAAGDAFAALGDFRDSADRAEASLNLLYDYAMSVGEQKKYALAGNILSVATGQPKWQAQSNYFFGMHCLAEANNENNASSLIDARYYFLLAGDFSDAPAQAAGCVDKLYAMGDAALAAGDYAGASNAYRLIPESKDADALTRYVANRELEAKGATAPENYARAAEAYDKDPDVRDSAERAAACRETLFQLAETAVADGNHAGASVLYGYQPEYKDGRNRSAYAAAMAKKTAVPAVPEQYIEAADAFTALGKYSDAAAQAKDCIDQLRAMGDAALAAGRYADASNAYSLLPDPDEAYALTRYTVNRNTEMKAATNPKNYVMAAEAYEKASDVRDSAERAAACRETLFQLAETAYTEGRYDDASVLYGYQPEYKDGQNRSVYASAMAREAAAKADATQYAAAADIYETLGDFSDAAQRAADCRETLFQMAETALAEGRYTDAAAFYSSQPTYNTADKQVEYVSALALEAEGKNNVGSYLKAAEAFDAMDGFRDTADRAEACRKAYYDHAAALVEAGEYTAAVECLTALGEYSDAPVLCKYSNARALMDKQMNAQALPLLTELGDYRDSAVLLGQVQDTLYQGALKLFASAEFIAAANQFRLLGDYKDAVAFASYAEGLEAEAAWLAGKENRLEEAKEAFAAAGDFKDAAERLRKVTGYADGLVKYRAGDWEAAAAAFEQVSDYQQAGQLAIYSSALANEAKGDAGDVNGYIAAADLYESLGNYRDASNRAVRLRNKLNILFADQVRAESEGIRAVKRNGKWGFANDKDELISDFQWDECRDFAEGFAAVKKDGQWGFIRANGTVLCTPYYSSAGDFHEGRARVYNGWHYNYLKTDGKTLWNSTYYTKATDFSQGRAMVYYDDWGEEWRIIDLNGKILLSGDIYINGIRYYIKASSQFANGFAKITVNTSSYSSSGNKNVYINLDCEYVSDTEPLAEGNYWKINNNGSDAYMNQKGVIVTYASKLDFNDEGYCITTANGLKGMIHKDGRRITGNEWNIIHHFSNDLALVKKGNYYGFIDRNGKVAITCQYNDAHDFSDGLALVKLNGMCGFINVKGELVVPLIYDDATDFVDGQARVQRYGQWTVIDTSGKPVK